jgi:eukaryotic-like serine/threonine-protein kinase
MAVDTMINTLVDGRYRVLRKLGTGGMANVYLAEDQELGRRVAIKVLDERHASDEQFVERFRREAKAAAALSHPNIVSIYDRGETDGTYYIAMEYLEGPSLKELVRQGTPSIRTAITYTEEILAALRTAHRRGLVHRDIKPHNVLVDAEGRLKVTDFGIARSTASQMTEAGSIIGTAQYLSPEQARGAPVDQRSDLYSVGILLYELLTGEVPFKGSTPLEIAMKHLSEVPRPPSRLRPEIPPNLDRIVLRALAKRPEDRYQSAEEMHADLERVQRGLPVSEETADAATAVLAGAGIEGTAVRTGAVVPPRSPYGPSTYYEYVPPVRRRPVWPWLLALVLLIAAGVGGWYAYDRISDEIAQAKPVTVPSVEGEVVELARANIAAAGLKARVIRSSNEDFAPGKVFDQDPDAGEKIDRGNTVIIWVSTGKPKVSVPDVVGRTLDDARTLLQGKGLRVNSVDVYSQEPVGTVIAQDPGGGETVVRGTQVRINVSQGPRPVTLPNVIGRSYDSAAATLTALGFLVGQVDVDANDPAGTVVDMDPPAGSAQPPGTKIILSVSRGPRTTAVPDVEGLDRASAVAQLRNAGFKVAVAEQSTENPDEDGIVLSQDPQGGAQAQPNSTILITVGVLVSPTTTDTTDGDFP